MGARRCTAQVFFHLRLPRVAPFWSDCVAIGRRDVKGWVGEDRLDMSSSSFMKTLKKRGHDTGARILACLPLGDVTIISSTL